jgi:hypothetical protein
MSQEWQEVINTARPSKHFSEHITIGKKKIAQLTGKFHPIF